MMVGVWVSVVTSAVLAVGGRGVWVGRLANGCSVGFVDWRASQMPHRMRVG